MIHLSFQFIIPIKSKLCLLGKEAFLKSSLKSILIPSGVKHIESRTFAYCSNLICIEINSNDCLIGESCFIRCQNLTIISFPNAKKIKICKNAFSLLFKNLSFFICVDCILKIE